MREAPSPETLAWLQQSATIKGSIYSQVLLYLLEQRPIPGTVELAAPAPETAPVVAPADCPACEGMPSAFNNPCCVCGLSRPAQPASPAAPAGGLDGGRLLTLLSIGSDCGSGATLSSEQCRRAVALLAQQAEPAPALVPVPVSERLPGEGDLDANGRCWVYQNGNSTTHWLPASAIPLPQAGEVPNV